MMSEQSSWMHPWLRIERATRAVLADRLTRSASDRADAALAKVMKERERVERAGWFN
jgi:hypothetical protein